MVLMAKAEGVSTIKESIFENRFLHVSELRRMGAQIEINGNEAKIFGKSKQSGMYTNEVFPKPKLFKSLYKELKNKFQQKKLQQIVLCYDKMEASDDDAPDEYFTKRSSLLIVENNQIYGFTVRNRFDD